eukprot:1305805-Pleurochrysis_carterae.AAC.2
MSSFAYSRSQGGAGSTSAVCALRSLLVPSSPSWLDISCAHHRDHDDGRRAEAEGVSRQHRPASDRRTGAALLDLARCVREGVLIS